MKIISLGSICHVKYNINRLFEPQERCFFDWLITDFKSVLYVFKNINNKELLDVNNFTNKNVFMNRNTWTDCHKIEYKLFKMVSVHDIPLHNEYMYCMDDFVNNYKRRLERIRTMIESDETIHMIHCPDHLFCNNCNITKEDIVEFKNYLHNINPNHKCILHIAIPPKYNNNDFTRLIQDNVYVYYLKEMLDGNNDWTNTNFNWEIIFDNIKNIG
jgi:hypothetical protein